MHHIIKLSLQRHVHFCHSLSTTNPLACFATLPWVTPSALWGHAFGYNASDLWYGPLHLCTNVCMQFNILCRNLISCNYHNTYNPGLVPGSANQCILEDIYLRSDLLRKPYQHDHVKQLVMRGAHSKKLSIALEKYKEFECSIVGCLGLTAQHWHSSCPALRQHLDKTSYRPPMFAPHTSRAPQLPSWDRRLLCEHCTDNMLSTSTCLPRPYIS